MIDTRLDLGKFTILYKTTLATIYFRHPESRSVIGLEALVKGMPPIHPRETSSLGRRLYLLDPHDKSALYESYCGGKRELFLIESCCANCSKKLLAPCTFSTPLGFERLRKSAPVKKLCVNVEATA